MTASVPFLAPARPPLTGASTATIFFSARPCATRCAARGPLVDMSMKVLIFEPLIAPVSPSAAFSTIAGVGRLAKTISASEATAEAEFARWQPRASNGARAASLVSKTLSVCPASSRRTAMCPPMRPTPTKPKCLPVTMISKCW